MSSQIDSKLAETLFVGVVVLLPGKATRSSAESYKTKRKHYEANLL
ncbi:hypothetical protein M23134_04197 [Microscilla marina ATCC 23134]|uniref:Uncharacterized protein n=1 Tax=Microscilla marina ATCC 23134 TaxID=313606 RepID=A1ZE56_MICM2|nr:hypothetical protein M23134_04197 [Microscilla marina ATCC 23134]